MGDRGGIIGSYKGGQTMEEAFGELEELCRVLGFAGFLFAHIGTQDSPSTFKMSFFKTTFPEDWVRVYLENNYLYVDPVAKRVMNNELPFYWSEHVSSVPLSDEEIAMMTHGSQYGLLDGVGCSYLKNKGQLYIFTIAKTSPVQEYDPQVLADFYLAGAYLAELHYELNVDANQYGELTMREREIISMAAMGKTDSEISQLAGISTNTVRYHWKNIFTKMQSYSRVFSIIRALNLGYIELNIFELTTDSGSVEVYRKGI